MATITWTDVNDGPAARHGLSLAVSIAIHATLALLIATLAIQEVPPAPIEISIFEDGPRGPASPPPGKKSAEPGPVAPPAPAPKAAAAPKAPPAPKAPARKAPVAKAPPAPRAVENLGVLGALKKAPSAPSTTRAFEGLDSNVALRARPNAAEAAGPSSSVLGSARQRADVAVDAAAVASGGGPAVSGSLGSGVGTVALPGPGGGGSGWGGGGSGEGGGGSGRGGFSVSGAGSGGSGRSYSSIWQQTQRYLAGLRWAYNNELRGNAALRGVMTVRYEILPNGAVGSVTLVSSGLKNPRLEQQVLAQIRDWKYAPEPAGAVVVTWPFSFLPPS